MSSRNCAAILVVEDETDIREAIVEFLRDQGFDVYQAENGREALHVLKRTPHPALVLVDLMMPVMDGTAFIAALREDDRFATLPVIIVTAANYVTGPPNYRRLKKPVDFDELARIADEFCMKRC